MTSKKIAELPKKYEDAAAKCMAAHENFAKAATRMREASNIKVVEDALKVTPYDQYISKREILEQCIDTKGQQVVSIKRLAEVLGVHAPSKKDIERLVESRK